MLAYLTLYSSSEGVSWTENPEAIADWNKKIKELKMAKENANQLAELGTKL